MSDASEVLYILAAVLIFGLFATNLNRSMFNNTENTVDSEIEYNAISFGQSVIESARTKAFDEVTVGLNTLLANPDIIDPDDVPDGFTELASLGPDAGEVYPNFDDVDDYHGLNVVRESGYGDYTITAQVFYVQLASPTLNAGTKTSHKRLTVNINHPDIRNSINLSYVKSYY